MSNERALGIRRSIAPVKGLSGRRDLVGERRECDLDTPLGIVVKHEVRKIDQSIAEARSMTASK
jgi:hypothetical protein